MKKRQNGIFKNVTDHTLDIHTINHHMEIAEESFPTLLDPEGTLADCYVLQLENEMKKSG